MAYSVVINQARGGTLGKPGPPIVMGLDGARAFVYEVHESDVGAADVFELVCAPAAGIISLYAAMVTDDNGGTVLTMAPSFWTPENTTPAPLVATPADPIREANPVSYVSASGRLFFSSGVSAPGGEALTHIVIMEGHGHPTGLGDLYSPGKPVPVELYTTELPAPMQFTNETFGASMELANGSFGGTPILVYDADNVLWTLTEPAGNSLTPITSEDAHTGTNSAKWTNPNLNNTIQFEHPSSSQDLTGRVALTFWVKVTAGYSVGNSITVFGFDGLVPVGVPVALEDKINRFEFDVWQFAEFSMDEMGLETATIASFRLTLAAKSGAGPTLFIDDMAIQEALGSVSFRVAPPLGTSLGVRRVVITIQDDIPLSAGIDPAAFMGLAALSRGLLLQVVNDGAAISPIVVRDMCSFFEFNFVEIGRIGNEARVCMTFAITSVAPFTVTGDPALNYLEILVQDDMTGLDSLQAFADTGLRIN